MSPIHPSTSFPRQWAISWALVLVWWLSGEFRVPLLPSIYFSVYLCRMPLEIPFHRLSQLPTLRCESGLVTELWNLDISHLTLTKCPRKVIPDWWVSQISPLWSTKSGAGRSAPLDWVLAKVPRTRQTNQSIFWRCCRSFCWWIETLFRWIDCFELGVGSLLTYETRLGVLWVIKGALLS